MKLGKKKMMMLSFMLFSLFFGAGNLIFPPFLGQNAGKNTPLAIAFFLITAVVLPVLGVIVVAKFDGLDKLASRVNPRFALIFSILIYLSIGPGLGIPRAASVPFELAVTPYLPADAPVFLWRIAYSVIFFFIAGWLSMSPTKLIERIGKFLSPTLVCLLIFLFINFIFRGETAVAGPVGDFATNPAVTGFLNGYQTMDAIAALNFGLVIALTLQTLGIESKKETIHYTVLAGIFAGTILSMIYLMLSYLGMASSGVFAIQENGALTLRIIVHQLFGNAGAILLAAIFTLACLTTCVGLITSISQFFEKLFKKIPYRTWVILIAGFSVIICNQGLTTILKFSIPVLDAIYPVSIILIVFGICDQFLNKNPYIYPFTIATVAVTSIVYSLENAGLKLSFIQDIFHALPFYSLGLGWVPVAFISMIISVGLFYLRGKKHA